MRFSKSARTRTKNYREQIFQIVSTYNIHLNLFYISSADNPADTPSRAFPLQDSKLSPSARVLVQAEFGGRSGHSADLVALPSNLQCALDGSPFLSFPHIPFLALLESICLPSILIIMVAFFQTPMFFPPLFLSHRFCGLSKLMVLRALLLFLTSGLVDFGGLYFNRIRLLLAPQGTQDIVLPLHHRVILPLGLSLGICGSSTSFQLQIYLNRLIPFCFHVVMHLLCNPAFVILL